MSRVLIVPMGAMAETAGSIQRSFILGKALKDEGHEVGICLCKDPNYRKPEGFTEFPLTVPVPLGLPGRLGNKLFERANKLGITRHKEVRSFEEVLHLTGNSAYAYLAKSVGDIRRAAEEFGPDVIYSEFSLPAVITAKLMGIRCFATASFPTQSEFACNPGLARGVNRFLRESGLSEVKSALDVFKQADRRFVPSIPELEPLEKGEVFCGAWRGNDFVEPSHVRGKILVYMGNGTAAPEVMVREVSAAFRGCEHEVFIAGQGLPEKTDGNIRTAGRFDFSELLPECALYINHGGQNSIADALIHGVPQLLCPGKVFERKYNAGKIAELKAGISIDAGDFKAGVIREKAGIILSDGSYADNAAALGRRMCSYEGAREVCSYL